MEESLNSTIVKIRRQEQNEEAKLKAKREFQTTKESLLKSIRETIAQAKKYQDEKMNLIKRTDENRAQLVIQEIRRDVLAAQVKSSSQELKRLREEVEHELSEIRELRTSYYSAVHETVDECDVWALLMRPGSSEPLPRPQRMDPLLAESVQLVHEGRLAAAVDRRQRACAERERLLAEPDTAEEFVRIKNALRYSMEQTARLRK